MICACLCVWNLISTLLPVFVFWRSPFRSYVCACYYLKGHHMFQTCSTMENHGTKIMREPAHDRERTSASRKWIITEPAHLICGQMMKILQRLKFTREKNYVPASGDKIKGINDFLSSCHHNYTQTGSYLEITREWGHLRLIQLYVSVYCDRSDYIYIHSPPTLELVFKFLW